jgi:tripartite-type tricarboxylate transporter receptor subunit TctC
MKRIFACAALALFAVAAAAQTYPAKPIRLVVPFPPGGGVDLTARVLQQRMSAALGQPMVVDNRGGATGMIGAEIVARAAPDGYTLAYTVGSDLAMKRFVTKGAYLDLLTDFTPIAPALESVSCIAVAASGPATLRELIDLARRNPGKLNFGSAGINSSQHITGELFRQHGVDMVHVPFNGLAPGLVALLGGQIEVSITNFASVANQLRDGKVRVLAVTRPKRYEDAPQVPTVGEELPGFNMPVAFFGFFGPPGLPLPIVQRVNAEVGRALEAPEVTAKVKELYMSPVYTSAEQFVVVIRNAIDEYGKIVKSSGIQPQ